MSDLDLIRMALKEHNEGLLTEREALVRITVVVNTRPPSKECIAWALGSLAKPGKWSLYDPWEPG